MATQVEAATQGRPTQRGSGGPPPVATRHAQQAKIVTTVERPDATLVAAYRTLYTGLVLDHLGKHGGMSAEIKPVWGEAALCGPAVTCLGPDWRIRAMAADLAEPGDVIVLAVGGVSEHACFGDMTATRWQAKGIEGVVIDGATRDVAGIRALGFPVFARQVTPRNYHYPAGADHGAVNVPVVCGGVLVEPGDIVLGDDDGVVVVPKATADAIASAAETYLEKENEMRALLAQGYVPYGVAEELEERGYQFI